MDIEAYAAAHQDEWDRLERLVTTRRLSGPQADELVRLYQSAAGNLAVMMSGAAGPDQVVRLSQLVGRARGRVAGAKRFSLRTLSRFFTQDLPLSFYRIRYLILVLIALSLGIAAWQAIWLINSPQELTKLGSEAQLRQYAEQAFAAYYSNYPAPDFAAQVWTNNARLAVLGVATGITGIVPIYLLAVNFLGLGSAAAIMWVYGDFSVFLGLITPHGLLELTSIVVACALGLRLFWSVLVPGGRSRTIAIAAEGRSLAIGVVGLVLMLAGAGLLEAFVTPSSLPPLVKVVLGAGALLVWIVYVAILGRRAGRANLTGDLEENLAGYVIPEAS